MFFNFYQKRQKSLGFSLMRQNLKMTNIELLEWIPFSPTSQ